MTVQNDYDISLEILQHLGEVVAEVTNEGLINDVIIRDKEKYPGEEERYRGHMLSEIHPPQVADQFLQLIHKSLKTGESAYMEFQTSYKRKFAIYSVRILPYHPDKRRVYFIIDDITTKERIELLENKWKLALDASGDGMWDYNIVTDTIHFSDKWHEIFGYSKAEINDTKAWNSKLFPEDVQMASRRFEDYLAGKTESYVSEFRYRCKDDSIKWIQSRGVIISRTPDGQPLRMIGTHTDITERKNAEQVQKELEEQLRSQRNFYEQILNKVPANIAVFDKDFRYRFINASSVRDTELRQWLIGKTDIDYCTARNKPVELAERRLAVHHKVAETKQQQEWEEKLTHKDGSIEYQLRKLYPVLDAKDEIEMMIGYSVDVTEQIQDREALKTSNEMFSSAFDYSGIGMALVSPFGKWLNVNNCVCEITGYSKEELKQLTFQDITHPDDLEMDLELLRKMLAKEIETYSIEKRYISKTNKIVWALLTVTMVWNADGTPKFFISQIIDITKKKELADEISRKNCELEAAQASLINKIHQLEELNYIIAHNLRGPARNIQMLATALNAKQSGEVEDEQVAAISEAFTTEEAISMMYEGANALTENLNTLMEVAKISLQKNLQYDHCDVEQIISSILSQLNGVIYEKQAQINLKLATRHIGYPKVYLESILYNFISNALKYTRNGITPEVVISTSLTGNKMQLAVKDNGLGIDLDRYSDRLFKLNQVFHKGFDSKGIGLFLTKSQVEALGGSIEVKSKVGEGTEFIVTL